MAFDYTNYYQLDYLESDGNQYVLTDISANSVTSFEFDITPVVVGGDVVFGARDNNDDQNVFSLGLGQINYPTGVFNNKWELTSLNLANYVRSVVKWEDDVVYQDGVALGTSAKRTVVNKAVRIFALNYTFQWGAKFRLHYCKINNVEFYPAQRKSDGVAGLYNTTDSTFLTNAGSGSFIKGGIICDINDFYTLSYLDTSGTQCINTDVKPFSVSNFSIQLDATPLGNSSGIVLFSANSNYYVDTYRGRLRGIFNNTALFTEYGMAQNSRTTITLSRTNGSITYSDSYNNISNTISNNGTTTSALTLFKKDSSYGTWRIYSMSVSMSGNLVKHFIPVERKSDGVAGLFDTVDNVFYQNAGNGEFITGGFDSTPQEYSKLSYIQSSGTQYVGIDIKDTECKGFEISYLPLNTSSGYFNYLGAYYDNFNVSQQSTRTSTLIRIAGNIYGGLATSTSDFNDASLTNGILKFNGTQVATGFSTSLGNKEEFINVFRCSGGNANYSTVEIRSVKLYDTSNILITDFVPAVRNADGVYGFYDVENDLFYKNNGTGIFTAGSGVAYLFDLNATTGGSVSGGGNISVSPDGNAYFTIVAVADEGYDFLGWYSDSSHQTLVSSNPIFSGAISENTTLYALFSPQIVITITYDSNYGTASYVWSGQNIILTATPNSSGQFVGWYIGSTLLSTNNPYTYEPQGDTTIECRFEEVYSVTASAVGNGAISYTRGADQNDITFTVIPDEHYHFVKYSVNGTDTATNPLTIHLTQATTVTAYFEEDTVHHITATTNIGYNSVFISANDVYYGTPVILWARPYPNYNFVRWDDGNTDNPRTIMVTANVTMVAIFQREFDTNGIYQYRCYVKDQMDLTEKPKAFMRVDTFNIKNDLMTTANSTITVLDSFSNVNNGDVLVLYDPMGTTLYQGVIKSIEDNKIVCSQMQSFYSGTWIYNIYPSATLEEELAYLLGQYAQGKIYNSTYTDPLVAQRLGGITIDYTASTSVNLPTDLDSDGNENLTEYDMEKFIYDMYEKYGIIFDFEISFAGTNYVHIKVPTYSSMKVGNNMYAIKDMKPVTAIEETNRLIIFAQDKSYRTTYVATANSIEEEPSTTANRFDLTNTKIVYSDDAVADLIAANLPDQMYNHKLDFTLVIKNFIYQFGDFNLGGSLDIYYYDEYYNSVLSGYEISKASNQNITEVKMVCGKVRSKLTQKLTLGRLQ